MPKGRADKLVPGHPLAGRNGRAYVSRLVLWDKTPKPRRLKCHWCGCRLSWQTVCADHLDNDRTNNAPANIVASCRGCNVWRMRQHRVLQPKRCEQCRRQFIGKSHQHHERQRFCSYRCARIAGAIGKRASGLDSVGRAG